MSKVNHKHTVEYLSFIFLKSRDSKLNFREDKDENELKNASINEDYSAKVLDSIKRLKNLGIEASNRGFDQLEKQNPGKLFPKEFITNQISKAMTHWWIKKLVHLMTLL